MTYQLTVAVKDGKAVVEKNGATMAPDGRYMILGHTPTEGTWPAEDISVERRDTSGRVVIRAAGTHHLGYS